jgi:hypothetical protein
MNRGVRETGSRRDTDYEALMATPFESCGGFQPHMSLRKRGFKRLSYLIGTNG